MYRLHHFFSFSEKHQDSQQPDSSSPSSAPPPLPSSSSSSSSNDDKWLSHVEILTHAPPSRRLWMGPQFSFKTYHSSALSGKTSSSYAATCPIKTPSPPNTIIYSGSLTSSGGPSHNLPHHTTTAARTTGTVEGTCAESTAVLSLSAENPLVDIFSEPSEVQSLNLKSLDTSPLPTSAAAYGLDGIELLQEGHDTGQF